MYLRKREEYGAGKWSSLMSLEILVVDDSALLRRVECDIINSDNNFQVTDVCRDGIEAYEKIKANSYDGVILDVNMPKMDGLQLLKKLQQEKIKANVIMVSTLTTENAETTIMALELGALDFVAKPTNIIEAKGEAFKNKLLSVLNSLIRTRNIAITPVSSRVTTRTSSVSAESPMTAPKQVGTVKRLKASGNNKLIALACSTGGPKALQSVIPFLPKNIDAPMVLVQHMPAGFTKSMADRLNEISEVEVKEYIFIIPHLWHSVSRCLKRARKR